MTKREAAGKNRRRNSYWLYENIGKDRLQIVAPESFLGRSADLSRRGLFFYYGDYNVQQVPFLIYAHRAVREGRFFWTPMVDLGGNMGGIFSFYLWGSPFFWLTIPFPESWLPFMMPFLMALKYGTASAAACAWIRTQTKTDLAAVLGAFLYAFSGFQACNIVFQHFHDATAFFPLYLLAFDRFVQGRGKGRSRYGFVLMTALMSVINYYFFFGQVLFLVLYYMIRRGIRLIRSEGLPVFAGEVLRIVAAGAFGLMLSAFFLVQSIGGIMGNARISKILNGYDLVAYPDAVTPLAILKSFFMIPDLVARGTLFTSDYVKNGSLAFYLPCFPMPGVFAYWMMRRLSWKKTLLRVLLVMAFVPALNASFSAFNANYYARWFYMPLLLCACMTAEVMEKEDTAALTRGGLLNLGITVLFLLMCFLPVEDNGKWSFTAVCNNRKLLTTQIYGTLFGMAVLCVILVLKRRLRNKAKTVRIICLVLTIVCCISSTIAVLHNGSSLIAYTGFEKWKKQMLTQKPVLERRMEDYPLVTNWDEGMPVPAGQGGKPLSVGGKGLTLPAEESREPLSGDAPFSRVETDSTSTNYELVWGIPTMHCFESTVHPSIFKWYRGIGMIRTVESTLPMERIGARAFQDCVRLQSAKMDKVTSIGPMSFEFCSELSDIETGDITDIGDYAFSHCSNLDLSDIRGSLTEIGAGAFAYTATKRADFRRMKEIPEMLFCGCSSLEYADFRNAGIIGNNAFGLCSALKFIRLGDIEKIGARAFNKCSSLEFSSLPPSLRSIGDDAILW